MEKFLEKIKKIIYFFMKKCDDISNNIKEKTGIYINVGAILLGIILFIILIIFIKGVLGWVKTSLMG